jgi:hypothetical protein
MARRFTANCGPYRARIAIQTAVGSRLPRWPDATSSPSREPTVTNACWHIRKDRATADEARKSLACIRRRLMQAMQRIGPLTRDQR